MCTLMDLYMGGGTKFAYGGVQNPEKNAYVHYGVPSKSKYMKVMWTYLQITTLAFQM